MTIFLAILLGTLFGFVLQRVGAADPDKIIDMLRLTDLHLAKTILAAIGVSSFFLFIGMALGLIDSAHLSVKPAYLGVVVGGLILGVGWSIGGFCPGTAVAAVGTGRKDSLWFIAGGLLGAAIFMISYQSLADTTLFKAWAIGKVTLAQTGEYDALIHLNGTMVALLLAVALIGLAFLLPKALRK